VRRKAKLGEDLVQLMAVGDQPLVQLVPDPLVAGRQLLQRLGSAEFDQVLVEQQQQLGGDPVVVGGQRQAPQLAPALRVCQAGQAVPALLRVDAVGVAEELVGGRLELLRLPASPSPRSARPAPSEA
jgi:hypothetical protein